MISLVLAISIGLVILLTGYFSWKYVLDQNTCSMTYSKIERKEIPVDSIIAGMKLFIYRNSKSTKLATSNSKRDSKSRKQENTKSWDYILSPQPILFIPGHFGNMDQVRSLNSPMHNDEGYFQYFALGMMSSTSSSSKSFPTSTSSLYSHLSSAANSFVSPITQSISAFHGSRIIEQAVFMNDAMKKIHQLYVQQYGPDHPFKVLVVGHSLGGLVARTASLLSNHMISSVMTSSATSQGHEQQQQQSLLCVVSDIILLSTPIVRPPYSIDVSSEVLYTAVNRAWRQSFYHESKECLKAVGRVYSSSSSSATAASERVITTEWQCPVCTSDIRLVSISGGEIDHLVHPSLTSLDTFTTRPVNQTARRLALQRTHSTGMTGSSGVSGSRGMLGMVVSLFVSPISVMREVTTEVISTTGSSVTAVTDTMKSISGRVSSVLNSISGNKNNDANVNVNFTSVTIETADDATSNNNSIGSSLSMQQEHATTTTASLNSTNTTFVSSLYTSYINPFLPSFLQSSSTALKINDTTSSSTPPPSQSVLDVYASLTQRDWDRDMLPMKTPTHIHLRVNQLAFLSSSSSFSSMSMSSSSLSNHNRNSNSKKSKNSKLTPSLPSQSSINMVDHQAIVWCYELLHSVTHLLSTLSHQSALYDDGNNNIIDGSSNDGSNNGKKMQRGAISFFDIPSSKNDDKKISGVSSYKNNVNEANSESCVPVEYEVNDDDSNSDNSDESSIIKLKQPISTLFKNTFYPSNNNNKDNNNTTTHKHQYQPLQYTLQDFIPPVAELILRNLTSNVFLTTARDDDLIGLLNVFKSISSSNSDGDKQKSKITESNNSSSDNNGSNDSTLNLALTTIIAIFFQLIALFRTSCVLFYTSKLPSIAHAYFLTSCIVFIAPLVYGLLDITTPNNNNNSNNKYKSSNSKNNKQKSASTISTESVPTIVVSQQSFQLLCPSIHGYGECIRFITAVLNSLWNTARQNNYFFIISVILQVALFLLLPLYYLYLSSTTFNDSNSSNVSNLNSITINIIFYVLPIITVFGAYGIALAIRVVLYILSSLFMTMNTLVQSSLYFILRKCLKICLKISYRRHVQLPYYTFLGNLKNVNTSTLFYESSSSSNNSNSSNYDDDSNNNERIRELRRQVRQQQNNASGSNNCYNNSSDSSSSSSSIRQPKTLLFMMIVIFKQSLLFLINHSVLITLVLVILLSSYQYCESLLFFLNKITGDDNSNNGSSSSHNINGYGYIYMDTGNYVLNVLCLVGGFYFILQYVSLLLLATVSSTLQLQQQHPFYNHVALLLFYLPAVVLSLPTLAYSYQLFYSHNRHNNNTDNRSSNSHNINGNDNSNSASNNNNNNNNNSCSLFSVFSVFEPERVHYCMAVFIMGFHLYYYLTDSSNIAATSVIAVAARKKSNSSGISGGVSSSNKSANNNEIIPSSSHTIKIIPIQGLIHSLRYIHASLTHSLSLNITGNSSTISSGSVGVSDNDSKECVHEDGGKYAVYEQLNVVTTTTNITTVSNGSSSNDDVNGNTSSYKANGSSNLSSNGHCMTLPTAVAVAPHVILGSTYRVVSCACYKDHTLKLPSDYCEWCQCKKCGGKNLSQNNSYNNSYNSNNSNNNSYTATGRYANMSETEAINAIVHDIVNYLDTLTLADINPDLILVFLLVGIMIFVSIYMVENNNYLYASALVSSAYLSRNYIKHIIQKISGGGGSGCGGGVY